MKQEQAGVREGTVAEPDLTPRRPFLKRDKMQALVGVLEPVHCGGSRIMVEHVEHRSHRLEGFSLTLHRDESAPHLTGESQVSGT